MAPTLACMAGKAFYRLKEQGAFNGREVGRRDTPFGQSETIYLVEGADAPPYYLLPRHGAGKRRVSSTFVNHRANFYALKDLGVQHVLAWSAAGAISHNYNIGDLVLVSDLIDRTTCRARTFFENNDLGALRQFPVFCPPLLKAMGGALAAMRQPHRESGALVVTEGPRLETPAEIRLYSVAGAELIGHNFAPEAFLAKELELCFAGLAYVVNYAETGSHYRPFSAADLFGGLAAPSDSDRINHAINSLPELLRRLSKELMENPPACQCSQTMRYEAQKHNLPADWRQWFEAETGVDS